MKKRWIILMTMMVIIAIGGLFASEPSFECDMSKIDGADVAWLITATIFVLMMTPGLSFFYGGMVGARNVISTMLQSFYRYGTHLRSLGGIRIQSCIRRRHWRSIR